MDLPSFSGDTACWELGMVERWVNITYLRYTDDTVILANSEEKFQNMVNICYGREWKERIGH